MTLLYIVAGLIIALAIVMGIVFREGEGGEEQAKYQYRRRKFFMTRAEHECFDALMEAVGKEYFIFAQVHLPTLIDEKVTGQSWKGAFWHVNGKSVDFVLCDKAYIAPRLAIELDDRSHERPDRQARDREVERILQVAGMPLLRLENRGRFDPGELAQRVNDALAH